VALFEKNIQSGAWPVHSKLKDEIALAQEFEVSRGTLRKAIKELVAKAVLTQTRGKGTFVVSSDLEQQLASRFVSFSESLEEKDIPYQTIVLKKEVLIPDLKVAAFLELPQRDPVVCLERVRLVGNVPVIYLKSYVPLALCPGLMEDDLAEHKLFELIERKYSHKILWGRRYFKAVSAFGDMAYNLGLPAGAPVMYLEQVAYTRNADNPQSVIPIEYSHVWINSERFEIASVIER
jgi:GntR family transcriptional regulator